MDSLVGLFQASINKDLYFPQIIKAMQNSSKNRPLEPEKLVAERINGWAAMVGFWAAVGAYLTTGQIIPGII